MNNMSNNELLKVNNDTKPESEAYVELINKAFATLLSLASAEVLQATRYEGVCRPLRLRYAENGNKITITADKVGKLAAVEVVRERGHIKVVDNPPTSLLTAAEAERLIGMDTNGHDFLPIENAVEILSRSIPEVHAMVEDFLKAESPKVLVGASDIAELLMVTKNSSHARMLTTLASSVDNYINRCTADLDIQYRTFLRDSPIGTEKIIRALRLVTTIAKNEQESLLAELNSSEPTTKSCLKDVLKNSARDYEAARKIIGKLCLTGAFFPVILMKATHIYANIFMRPTYR